jgi:hypothetical protein
VCFSTFAMLRGRLAGLIKADRESDDIIEDLTNFVLYGVRLLS